MSTITNEFTAVGQKARYSEIVELDGVKYRVRIERDSYDFQSYARVEVWSDAFKQWNMVHVLDPGHSDVVELASSYTYRAQLERDPTAARMIEATYADLAHDLIVIAQKVAG